MSLNTAAPSYAAGSVLTAAQLNALQDGIQAPWTSYVPQWTAATTNPTLDTGTLAGSYLQIGKTVFFRLLLTPSATTTQGSGQQFLSLPIAPNTTGEQAVHLKLYTGTANFVGHSNIPPGTSVLTLLVPTSTGNCSLTPLSSASPNVGTTGNLALQGFYEAA